MSIRVLNFSLEPLSLRKSRSLRPCGSWSSVMAGQRGSTTTSPRPSSSFRRAIFTFFLALSTRRSRFDVFFEWLWMVTPPVRRSMGAPLVCRPCASASSRSSSSSSSAISRSMPRKKLCAVTKMRGFACSSARPTMFTVRASVHTRLRYRSIAMSRPFFAATSLSPPSASSASICESSDRFSRSSRPFWFECRTSEMMCSFSSLRSALSGTLKSRNASEMSSPPSCMPRFFSRISVCTQVRRSSGSRTPAWRSRRPTICGGKPLASSL